MSKVSKSEKIRQALAKYPDLSVKALAKKLKVSAPSVYLVRWKQNKDSPLVQQEIKSDALAFPAPAQNMQQEIKSDALAFRKIDQQNLRSKTALDLFDSYDEINWHQEADPIQPEHYRVGGIETIDFIEAKNLNYRLGNVVKYVSRAPHHSDGLLENLKKAQWYLAREISAVKQGK